MKYVIKRFEGWGGYVANKGRRKSYTNVQRNARVYDDLESAKYACCDNEAPVKLKEGMGR